MRKLKVTVCQDQGVLPGGLLPLSLVIEIPLIVEPYRVEASNAIKFVVSVNELGHGELLANGVGELVTLLSLEIDDVLLLLNLRTIRSTKDQDL